MPTRTHTAILAGLLAISMADAPRVHAVEITRGGITYYDFFNSSGALPVDDQAFGSFARDFTRRSGFIENDGAQQRVDEQDPLPSDPDFQGVRTFTPGETVGMRSNLLPVIEPSPPPPARARTDKFSNHAHASTERTLEFVNSRNTGEFQDNQNPDDDYFIIEEERAEASSQWGDTWTATRSEHVSLDFALEGSLVLNQSPLDCLLSLQCGIAFPPGALIARVRDFKFDLNAAMVVYDLSTLVPCEAVSEDCDGQGDAPLPLDSIAVRAGASAADDGAADHAALAGGQTLSVAISDTLEFEAVAGHEYYVLSFLSLVSEDGVKLDFFNSFKLTGVNASPGSLLSSALGGLDITTHFSPVPLPAAFWLMLGGVGALATRSARPVRASA